MATLVAPVRDEVEHGEDDELSHVLCECNERFALCGADVSAHHRCPEDCSCGCAPCVVCEDLIDWPCRFCGE